MNFAPGVHATLSIAVDPSVLETIQNGVLGVGGYKGCLVLFGLIDRLASDQ